jgi:hypothetical protein
MSSAITAKDKIGWRGVSKLIPAVEINGQAFLIVGNLIKTARLKKEWEEDVECPEEVVRVLKSSSVRADILRFWQRIPDSSAKHQYYRERREIAAIPVTTFEHWWKKQISGKTRNMVRKTEKLRVDIGEAKCDDKLVRGIIGIFNESPIRRGKPFWHYGKDFTTVKREMSADLDRAIFIAAYYQGELIGFIKLLLMDRYATITLILDRGSHRDKSPTNGMIAKAVEICAERHIPFITYTVWRRGDHGEFQKRNGFERIPVPEYFVPLTFKGRVALRLGLHKGLDGALPERLMTRLLAVRATWYKTKYRHRLRSEGRRRNVAGSSR